jgi:hypothetical protein
MAMVHRLLAGAFALLLDPLARFPPLVGLTMVSAVAGVVVLAGMRLASNPRAIRAAKQKVQAHLLATRLYRHELVTVWRSLGALLLALGTYLAQMLRPFIVLLIPFALLFAHLDGRYASRPLQPGERTIVKAVAAAGTPDQWRLEAPPGVKLDSVGVRLPARREIDWRVRAEKPGAYNVTLVAGNERVQKMLQVGGMTGASERRAQATLAALFDAPVEPSIATGSNVAEMEIGYPPQRYPVLGWRLHWVVVFLIVSAVVALLLHRRAGVEF